MHFEIEVPVRALSDDMQETVGYAGQILCRVWASYALGMHPHMILPR